MNLDFLQEFCIPVIVGICLAVGYLVKKWMKDAHRKFIPTLCAALGVFLAIWMADWTVSPAIVLQGLFSGLSATGLHQAFKQMVEKKQEP